MHPKAKRSRCHRATLATVPTPTAAEEWFQAPCRTLQLASTLCLTTQRAQMLRSLGSPSFLNAHTHSAFFPLHLVQAHTQRFPPRVLTNTHPTLSTVCSHQHAPHLSIPCTAGGRTVNAAVTVCAQATESKLERQNCWWHHAPPWVSLRAPCRRLRR